MTAKAISFGSLHPESLCSKVDEAKPSGSLDGALMQFDREKLKAAVLYTCLKCPPDRLGAVKLNKVLYFSDMLHYADVGTPITGATYRKRPHGPTCDELLPLLRDLQRTGALEIRESRYFGFRKKEFLVLQSPDVARLSADERLILDEVLDFVCYDNTARTISDFSHGRPWEIVAYGDVIPYRSALHLYPNQVTLDAFEWAAGEVDELASQGSPENALGYEDYAAFRSRVHEARRA
jgi:hypothetical protein